ncbi:major facilitator superfamily domain-containing protein [Xylariales sp. PMI_506]|nr:major facilitator superfamily domain-containing protein [Xylariales sp. PMI_506]
MPPLHNCPHCGQSLPPPLRSSTLGRPSIRRVLFPHSLERRAYTAFLDNAFSLTSTDTLASTLSIPERTVKGESYPDGGLQAWLAVAGAFACIFTSTGWLSCNAVFQSYYESTLLVNSSRFDISWISSTALFFMLFSQLFAGKIFDNYGPRILLAVGSAMHVTGLLADSFSREYYQVFLTHGIISPIGQSMISSAAILSLSTWFQTRRSLATGIAYTGSSAGAIILPIVLGRLLPAVGYGWTMRVSALIMLTLLVPANLAVRSNLQPIPSAITFREYLRPFKDINFCILETGTLFFFLAMYIPTTYIIVSATALNVNPLIVQYIVVIMNFAGLIGRLMCTYMADIWGRWNAMIALLAFTSMSVLALWLPSRAEATLVAFALLYGLGSNPALSMFPVLVAGISSIEEIGVRTGINQAAAGFAALVGVPIAGAIVAASGGGSFMWAAGFAGMCCVVSALCMCVVRIRLSGAVAPSWKV